MKKLILTLLTFLPLTLYAQTKLAPIYTDNMVVQQQTKVPIWGTANASQRITIITSWAPKDTVRTITNALGQWYTEITTPKADLVAHTIRCNELKINNVMLGEVWLCSGQSNMEWSVNHAVKNGEEEAKAATYPFIRIFQVPNRAALTPQLSLDASWNSCTPETMRKASAVGYFFARSLYKDLNVPIGIISSAWGGTPAEVWTPSECFDKDMLENACSDKNSWRPHEPSVAYNQMIYPLVPFKLAGVIWYQGESNRMWAANYDKLMQKLITGWRENFKNASLPFYFVQIAPFNYNNNKETYAAQLREAQEQTAAQLAGTGMVVVSDLVDNVNNIHPLNKQDVGARLANYALAEVYAKPIKDYKSPTYKLMEIHGNKALISFNNPTNALICNGKEIEGFTIAGADGKFVAAEAKIVENNVEVWSNEITKPVAVRYCFDDTSCGNLKTVKGLPIVPFRTDKAN